MSPCSVNGWDEFLCSLWILLPLAKNQWVSSKYRSSWTPSAPSFDIFSTCLDNFWMSCLKIHTYSPADVPWGKWASQVVAWSVWRRRRAVPAVSPARMERQALPMSHHQLQKRWCISYARIAFPCHLDGGYPWYTLVDESENGLMI